MCHMSGDMCSMSCVTCCMSPVTCHIGFAASILFRSIKQSIAAEIRCSPPHDFRHGGLHSHMPGACGLHHSVAGRAEKNKVCRLGSFSNG